VVDLSAIDVQYWMLNRSKIDMVVAAGTREITGLRIYPTTKVASGSKE